MKTISIKKLITIVAGALVIGLLLGWMVFGTKEEASSLEEHSLTEHEHGQTWTCSMHPQIRSNEPGNCPICGMALTPLNREDEGDPSAVRMSETAMRIANVQTTVVGMNKPEKTIRLNGKVQPDERQVYSQVSHIPGRIEKLLVNFTGEYVSKGKTLAMIYSPELVTAQEELLQAYKIRESQPALYEAAREKLRNWRLSEKTIDNIVTQGVRLPHLPITADVSGVVLNKRVNTGDYVDRGAVIFDIGNLSRVWVLLDVYESDMPWVKIGDQVSFTVRSRPGETFTGKITFIDPVIDPATRVATARIEVSNPEGKLKPEMFVRGELKSSLALDGTSLIIPKSAVLWTGERSIVYVKQQDEHDVSFRMQEVLLSAAVGDGYIVREGLTAGAEIVTHGTFSVDAAAQLAGKPSMMNPSSSSQAANHQTSRVSDLGTTARKSLQEIFAAYFTLKDALVEENSAAVNKSIEKLMATIEKAGNVQSDNPEWIEHYGKVSDALHHFSQAKQIAQVRDAFKVLSDQMVSLAKEFGSPEEQAFYVQYCPMADNDKGAYWLSKKSEIKNPYFGSSMLTCGEVTDTITVHR